MLTFFVSVARTNPLRPPWIVADSVEFGREMTARPDRKTTHLMHPRERDQHLIAPENELEWGGYKAEEGGVYMETTGRKGRQTAQQGHYGILH